MIFNPKYYSISFSFLKQPRIKYQYSTSWLLITQGSFTAVPPICKPAAAVVSIPPALQFHMRKCGGKFSYYVTIYNRFSYSFTLIYSSTRASPIHIQSSFDKILIIRLRLMIVLRIRKRFDSWKVIQLPHRYYLSVHMPLFGKSPLSLQKLFHSFLIVKRTFSAYTWIFTVAVGMIMYLHSTYEEFVWVCGRVEFWISGERQA